MFDVGFTELLLVFVIGLLILGPERLPRVAAQLGRWVAKARRTANQLRYQLEREVALDEIYKAQKKKPQKRPAATASGTPPAETSGTATSETAEGSAVAGHAPAEASADPVSAENATAGASAAESLDVPATANPESSRHSSPAASGRVEVATEQAVENAASDGPFRQSEGSR